MNNHGLTTNLLPLSLKVNELTIYYSVEETQGCKTLTKYWDNEFPAAGEGQKVWWSTESFEGAANQIVRPDEHRRIFSILLKDSLFNYFYSSDFICGNNFGGGISIWIPSDYETLERFQCYRTFTLKVIHDKQQYLAGKGQWCLQLVYSGTSFVSQETLQHWDFDQELLNKVITRNVISKFQTGEMLNRDVYHFVLNKDIENALGFPQRIYKKRNKYKEYYEQVKDFYERYLKNIDVGNFLSVQDSGFIRVKDSVISGLDNASNLLEFNNGNTHFNNFQGLKNYGPLKDVRDKNVKLFFIFSEKDKDLANRLYQYIKKGLKGFSGLEKFVGIPVNLDVSKTIRFASERELLANIDSNLDNFDWDDKSRYFAIYISPVRKDDLSSETRKIYYKVKSSLLRHGINSQVVVKDNIEIPSFNYFLPNIAIAILAKLGGIPWRLSRPVEEDLIIGVGAYRKRAENLALGTTICFKNDGSFYEFASIQSETMDDLSCFFKESIEKAIEKMSLRRVVIHFYKKMNKEEEKALTDAITDMNLRVPYVVLHIADSARDSYMLFDERYSAVMPVSGLGIRVKRDVYLITNNERYQKNAGMRISDFPFPIRVNISKTPGGQVEESEVPRLLDQIIQFSRMYWVGIKQKSLPVTILYSRKVAEFTEEFDSLEFPKNEVTQKTLWFL